MLDQIRRAKAKKSFFKEVIMNHFKLKKDIIKRTLKNWVAEKSVSANLETLILSELDGL
jgi:hypothetical protein